jgi:hypothetical protein
MINLESGTNSIWLSLRENLPVGITPSYFNLTFTNDMRGETYSIALLDTTPNSKWSVFSLNVGQLGDLDMTSGMYSYLVTASGSNTTLETGKAVVIETITRVTLDRPAKNTRVLKR